VLGILSHPEPNQSTNQEESMATMKAVRIHSYGGPEVAVYEDAPRPEPAPGEVLVRVRAAAVNPVDWMIRNGYGKEWWQHKMPLTLGCEYAGLVESAGSAITSVKPGYEV
jgi:NADPH:quinone reductase-like Zn-dependent oxidoreductase